MSEINVAVRTMGLIANTLSGAGGVRGGADLQVVHLLGTAATSDGGEGTAYWDAASSATEDGATVWGAGSPGRWIRLETFKAENVIQLWTQPGVFPTLSTSGGTDSSAGIQAVIDALMPGDYVDMGPWHYALATPLYWDNKTFPNCWQFKWSGRNVGNLQNPVSGFHWIGGAITGDVLNIGTRYCTFEGFSTHLTSGSARSLMRFGRARQRVDPMVDPTLNAQSKNWVKFEGLWFGEGPKAHSLLFDDSAYDFGDGVTVVDPGSNLENASIIGCRFQLADNTDDGLHISPYGQPYSTYLERVALFGGSNVTPHARGIYVFGVSTSVACYQVDVQQLETGFYVAQTSSFSVEGFQSEHCMRTVYVSGISGTEVTLTGGRVDMSSINTPSDGPEVIGDNRGWAYAVGRGSLTVNGVQGYGTSNMNQDAKVVYASHARVSLNACTLPTRDPVIPVVLQQPTRAGSVVVIGCTTGEFGVPGAVRSCDVYRGAHNPDGFVTFAGAETSREVVLTRPEPDTAYQVELSLRALSGSPPSGATRARVTAKTTKSFTVELDAAAGAGNVAAFGYGITKGAALVTTPSEIGTLRFWWDAGAGVTGSAPVTEWVDQVSGESLIGSGAPALTASDAAMGNLPTIALGAGDALTSDQAAAFWEYLNDASTGYTIVAVLRTSAAGSNTRIIATTGGVSTNLGIEIGYASGGNLLFTRGDGAGGSVQTGIPDWTSGKGNTLIARCDAPASGTDCTILTMHNDFNEWADAVRTMVAGAPAAPLTVSGPAAGSVSLAHFMIFDRRLDNVELEALREWARATHDGLG